jgi:hypothetical protein
MRTRITAIAAFLFLAVAACNKESKGKYNSVSKAEAPTVEKDFDSNADFKGYGTDSTAPTPPGNEQKKQPVAKEPIPNPDWDKKIIKTAFLNFEVKDYKAYYATFREKVRSVGGYVAQEEQSQSDYKIENTLVVKVPVDQFDNALAQLTNGSEKINERKITSQDVTAEFVDTKSRIEAKKQVRLRYMDLLGQAKNMQEILNVQSEINGIQEEIESATGRVEYLGHSAAYSTINITYYQILNSSAKDNEDVKPNFGTQLSAAFKTGWGWIVDLFVGIVSIWPLVLLGTIIFVWFRKSRKVAAKQA